jgi:hypothetical protein
MTQSVLEMAKDLVMAQIGAGRLKPENTQQALQQTYWTLLVLKTKEEPEAAGVAAPPCFFNWPSRGLGTGTPLSLHRVTHPEPPVQTA